MQNFQTLDPDLDEMDADLKPIVVDPDPDPVGSVYYLLSWNLIRIRIFNTDPDPTALKMITICIFLNTLLNL